MCEVLPIVRLVLDLCGWVSNVVWAAAAGRAQGGEGGVAGLGLCGWLRYMSRSID